MKLLNFIKSTKLVSKILFFVWVFFSIFANFSDEGRAMIVIDFTVSFLLPTLVIELCTNPMLHSSNSRILSFFKHTKVISRVLFCLWAFFSVLGAGNNISDFLYTFPALSLIFLLPIIIVENRKNPILSKKNFENIEELEMTTKQKHEKTKLHTVKLISKTKEASKQLSGILSNLLKILWNFVKKNKKIVGACLCAIMSIIGEILYVRNPIDDPATGNLASGNFSIMISFGLAALLLILPIRKIFEKLKSFIPKIPQNQKNTLEVPNMDKQDKIKTYTSHRVFGVIFAFFGVLFILSAVLGMSFKPTDDLGVLLVAGIFFLIFGVLFTNGTFTKMEVNKKKIKKTRGVYLTDEQIEKLENKIELPNLQTPIFLKGGEIAVYYCQANLIETKNRVIGRTGSYGGGTVRVAKGFSIHTGGSASQPIYGNVSTQYSGEFIITNMRIVFFNNQKGFEINHNNITAASYDNSGMVFQNKNKSYTLLFNRSDLAVTAFDGVRIGDIPIAGTYNNNYSNLNNFNERETSTIMNNTSSLSVSEHAELATSNLRTMTVTLEPSEFFQAYKNLLYHQEQVTMFWRSQGGDADSEELMESLVAEKEDYINEFFERCHNDGVLLQIKDSILRYSEELTKENVQYLEELLNGNTNIACGKVYDYDGTKNIKNICAKLKKNIKIDMDFWNEMHLEFRCNIVTSYDELQLNFEIKNTSGVPWYCCGGGIEIKANVYNAEDELLCVEEIYVEDDEIAKNRFSSYMLLHLDNVAEADRIEVYAYQNE